MFNIWMVWTSFRVNPSTQILRQNRKIVYRKGEQRIYRQRFGIEKDGRIYELFWKI